MSARIDQLMQSHPNNRGWDGLKVIFQNCGAYTIVPSSLSPFISNIELTSKIADQNQLLQLCNLLKRDVKEFSDKLLAIYATHKDRAGSATNGDDLMAILQTQESYVRWASSYEAVVMPTIANILDLYANAGADTQGVLPDSPVAAVEPSNQE